MCLRHNAAAVLSIVGTGPCVVSRRTVSTAANVAEQASGHGIIRRDEDRKGVPRAVRSSLANPGMVSILFPLTHR
ncbi:hypothetical protein SAMN02745244_00188 [Tessaracoccus bendigoensis DSM 12906]|uniref:Uncharacterized protein n=1 Tax=Tessaracoccus bendigoensis DSM 12906 TaxID=1123357 RepID=A0A1M6AGC4_9ACTN|nr:hypothetical protein SAMN02745244_00188 [Tessaracoccus bendigoensis DSM 12906]